MVPQKLVLHNRMLKLNLQVNETNTGDGNDIGWNSCRKCDFIKKFYILYSIKLFTFMILKLYLTRRKNKNCLRKTIYTTISICEIVDKLIN